VVNRAAAAGPPPHRRDDEGRFAMVVTVLRWIAAGIAALLVVGALASFALYIAFEARPASSAPSAWPRGSGCWR
jgi:hypothetical protein